MSVVSLTNVPIYAASHLKTPILNDVCLTVEPGELIYLIGKVGSGKSSLLRTLYGELPIKGGTAQVCEHSLWELNANNFHTFRRKIGIVFQDYNLLEGMSIYKNLEFVLRATDWKKSAAINKRVGEVLEMVSLTDKAYRMPHEISGGERQRVCIARALLNSPKLILADEPTGNLDPVAASEVVRLFRTIAATGECSVIVSTHNSENIRLFPGKALRCSDGLLEEV